MTLNRIVNVKVLPGQPTDGNGKVCIHLFVQDERGPFVEPAVIHAEDGKLVHKPTRGRLACDPKRIVAAVTHNGITTVTMRTDDPRAVTCIGCKKSTDYQHVMLKLLDKER